MTQNSTTYKNESWSALVGKNGKSISSCGRKIFVRNPEQKLFQEIAKSSTAKLQYVLPTKAMMIKYLQIGLICIFLLSCGGQTDEANKENSNVDEEFFFVHVFDGYFPIPTRYIVKPTDNPASMARFMSAPLLPGVSLSEALNDNQYTGTIGIAGIEECSICRDHAEALSLLGEHEKVSLTGNLKVLKSADETRTKAVFFDDKEYVFVLDDNPRLYDHIMERMKAADGSAVILK